MELYCLIAVLTTITAGSAFNVVQGRSSNSFSKRDDHVGHHTYDLKQWIEKYEDEIEKFKDLHQDFKDIKQLFAEIKAVKQDYINREINKTDDKEKAILEDLKQWIEKHEDEIEKYNNLHKNINDIKQLFARFKEMKQNYINNDINESKDNANAILENWKQWIKKYEDEIEKYNYLQKDIIDTKQLFARIKAMKQDYINRLKQSLIKDKIDKILPPAKLEPPTRLEQSMVNVYQNIRKNDEKIKKQSVNKRHESSKHSKAHSKDDNGSDRKESHRKHHSHVHDITGDEKKLESKIIQEIITEQNFVESQLHNTSIFSDSAKNSEYTSDNGDESDESYSEEYDDHSNVGADTPEDVNEINDVIDNEVADFVSKYNINETDVRLSLIEMIRETFKSDIEELQSFREEFIDAKSGMIEAAKKLHVSRTGNNSAGFRPEDETFDLQSLIAYKAKVREMVLKKKKYIKESVFLIKKIKQMLNSVINDSSTLSTIITQEIIAEQNFVESQLHNTSIFSDSAINSEFTSDNDDESDESYSEKYDEHSNVSAATSEDVNELKIIDKEIADFVSKYNINETDVRLSLIEKIRRKFGSDIEELQSARKAFIDAKSAMIEAAKKLHFSRTGNKSAGFHPEDETFHFQSLIVYTAKVREMVLTKIKYMREKVLLIREIKQMLNSVINNSSTLCPPALPESIKELRNTSTNFLDSSTNRPAEQRDIPLKNTTANRDGESQAVTTNAGVKNQDKEESSQHYGHTTEGSDITSTANADKTDKSDTFQQDKTHASNSKEGDLEASLYSEEKPAHDDVSPNISANLSSDTFQQSLTNGSTNSQENSTSSHRDGFSSNKSTNAFHRGLQMAAGYLGVHNEDDDGDSSVAVVLVVLVCVIISAVAGVFVVVMWKRYNRHRLYVRIPSGNTASTTERYSSW